MNPPIIDMLRGQRDRANDEAANAQAEALALRAEVEALKARLAELGKPPADGSVDVPTSD